METKQRYPKLGDGVKVIQKKYYSSGQLTEGVVKEVLTKKRFHSRGHKVRLQDGTIGRVQEFVDSYARSSSTEKKVVFDPDELR